MNTAFIQRQVMTTTLLVVTVTLLGLSLFVFQAVPAQAAENSTVQTRTAIKSTYAVGEEVSFRLSRGSLRGTSTLAVHLSASNGGLFTGGNLLGGCTGAFVASSSISIAANTVNRAFCYKGITVGTDTISIILGNGREFLSYDISIVAATCTDGVLNQNETTIDVGGVCTIVPPPSVCPIGQIGIPPACVPVPPIEVCPIGTAGVFPICMPIVVLPPPVVILPPPIVVPPPVVILPPPIVVPPPVVILPPPVVDICPNIAGPQASVPEGFEKLENSEDCTPHVVTLESRKGSSSGGGKRVERRINSRSGKVLGASTVQCGQYLFDYLKVKSNNDGWEVKKLQWFLIGQGYILSANGVFDDSTDVAVRAFQLKYQSEILTPWVEAGYVAHQNPTGWVYQLTRWKINNMVCPGSEAVPVLIP